MLYSSGVQYITPFTCPDCNEHIFETDSAITSEDDLINATCTGCGHLFELQEIEAQAEALPDGAIPKMLEDAAALDRKYAGH